MTLDIFGFTVLIGKTFAGFKQETFSIDCYRNTNGNGHLKQPIPKVNFYIEGKN